MAEPFKLCPRCQLQAPLNETMCSRCGHQYRTAFAPPPPIDQTQAVYPASPPPGGGIDLTRPMDIQRMPSVYPGPAQPQPGPYVPPQPPAARPYGHLQNQLGSWQAQPPQMLPYAQQPAQNYTFPIVAMWVTFALQYVVRLIIPGPGGGAIGIMSWLGSLGLAIYLVTQDNKTARVSGWVVIGINIAMVVLAVVMVFFVLSMASRALGGAGHGPMLSPTR